MAPVEEGSHDRRRESSPNRETQDRKRETKENRDSSSNTASESRHDRREQRRQDAHDVRRDDDQIRRRDADDVLGDRSRRKYSHDDRGSYSKRRFGDDSSDRRREADDLRHSRRRHQHADSDDFAGESRSRQHQHHEGSGRERSPRNHEGSGRERSPRNHEGSGRERSPRHHEGSGRERSPRRTSSYHDKRVGHEERYGRILSSGYRDDLAKKDSSGNYQRNVDKEIGGDRFAHRKDAQKSEDAIPELFSVHRAKVQSVRPFGVFVRLEGFYKQGLVHLSQLSDHEVTDREDSDEVKVKAIGAVAGEGDQVWVKVISLKDDGGNVKIGCSLKLVSQSTGKDLDPNNIKLDQQQPKGNRPEMKKVTLDAIYNVVCSRCGGHGHLKTECYGMADKSYELIPEEEADFSGQLPQMRQAQTPLEEVRAKPGFGRGRAMVLPAWMTHGSGAAAPQQHGSTAHEKKKRKVSELPDKISTVEEAMALIAEVKKAKKDKHHRKEHKKHKKDKKSKRSSKKERSSQKDRG